jgi:pimeloyl-ACP methyl ester carboxylesterase
MVARHIGSPAIWVALVAIPGCVDVKTDPDETGEPVVGATVEFNPSASIVPFPNNLLRNPQTGKLNLPAQCNELPAQTALRAGVLNQLDGFGTFKPALQFTLTEAVDPASLAESVFLVRRATGTTVVDASAATPIPVVLLASMTSRASKDCATTAAVNSVIIVPKVPLTASSTYTVVVNSSLKTANGTAFSPSSTWGLVRQAANPVTVESGKIVSERTPLDANDPEDAPTLLGLDLLWKAHAQGLAFADAALKIPREKVLLAWEFSTQTTFAPIDATNPDSLASKINGIPLQQLRSITGGNTQAFLDQVLGGACARGLPCTAVGNVIGGGLIAPSYQPLGPNPLGGDSVPGAWSDPINPTLVNANNIIIAIAFVPAAAAPATGYPVVMFGHGLGQDKTNLFAVGAQLARAGFLSIAIDFPDHGDRAVKINDSVASGCDGDRIARTSPQCFVPFLSANLAATRDNFRQAVLDLTALSKALKACGTANCKYEPNPANPNPANNIVIPMNTNKIAYMGLSLGGIIGSMATAMNPDIAASVVSVPGAGLLDVIENTDSLAIRCSIVNSLIDAGVLMGDKFNPTAMTGLCTTDAWKQAPSYRTFANIARWVLDPADAANYGRRLAPRKVLLQKVVGDAVIPNVTTDALGALSGLMSTDAGVATSATPAPSPAAAMMGPRWVTYKEIPANAAAGFPGNLYQHASLLAPATGTAGTLGTIQIQTDAITYLLTNLAGL